MRKENRAFTLMKIMVVVVLIGLLAGLTTTLLVRRMENAKKTIARTQIKGLCIHALQQFYFENNFYPTTEQGLEALVRKPTTSPEPTSYERGGLASKRCRSIRGECPTNMSVRARTTPLGSTSGPWATTASRGPAMISSTGGPMVRSAAPAAGSRSSRN